MRSTKAWFALLSVFLGIVAICVIARIVIEVHSVGEVCDVCGKPATRHEKGLGGMYHYCEAHVGEHRP